MLLLLLSLVVLLLVVEVVVVVVVEGMYLHIYIYTHHYIISYNTMLDQGLAVRGGGRPGAAVGVQ